MMAEAIAQPEKIPDWAIRLRKVLAPAIVMKWDDSSAYVICPFPDCRKLHCHGSGRAREGYPNKRQSHCGKLGQQYQLIYPFDSEGVAKDLNLGFELDREAGFWRTVGADIEDPHIENYEDDAMGSATRSGSSEEDLVASLNQLELDKKEFAWFTSYCITNDVHNAERCLTVTTSSENLLRKKNSDGNTVLALVCMEGNNDMVKLLLERGSELDSKNKQGETPLIISLLFSQPEVAEYLVSQGASVTMRDNTGTNALLYAQELLQRLEDERLYLRSPSSPKGGRTPELKTVKNADGTGSLTYYEDPSVSSYAIHSQHQEKIDRVKILIANCIAHEETISRIRKHKRDRAKRNHVLKISISRSAVQAMVTVFRDAYQVPMAKGWKTFGYLDRGEAFDITFAVSGWSGGQFASIDGCLERELWTQRVFEFSRILGHKLAPDGRDKDGSEGSFNACHAEKQLMAFVLWHYTTLQEVPGAEATESQVAAYEKISDMHQCIRVGTGRMAACPAQCEHYRGPPVVMITPIINVTNAICLDCRGFQKRILLVTGINITLKESSGA